MTDVPNPLEPDYRDGDSLSNEEIEDYIRKYEELEQDFAKMGADLQDQLETTLVKLVGSDILERMRIDEQETLQSINSSDPKIRQVAIHLAVEHWGLASRVASQCETLAFNDPDVKVRETAIRGLGSCYTQSKDSRVGKLLREIAVDAKEPDSVRLRAYTALARLHGGAEYIPRNVGVICSPLQFDPVLLEHYSGQTGGEA